MFTITISKKIFEISRVLCRKIKKEWYAFALGKLTISNSDVDFQVTDIYVPRQEASTTHVYIPAEGMLEISDALDKIQEYHKDWILLGMWHSHGELKCFHSLVDLENINMIHQSFPKKYLPTIVNYEKIFGPGVLNEYKVEPMISGGLKGFKVQLGPLRMEINLRQEIDDELFFVTWYAHFYAIKALLEVLREHFETIPIFTAEARVARPCIISIVVNNFDQIEGKVFAYEKKPKEIDARLIVKEIDEAPIFASEESLDQIVSRIRVV